MKRFRIIVKGIVQGVGFRPFVYNLAKILGINGYVENTADGVVIEVEGGRSGEFIDTLNKHHPPLAKIDSIDVLELPAKAYGDFLIVSSSNSDGFTLVSPDVSICGDCLEELFNHADRRYLYPFVNCTNCGPRYSITTSVPYDRPNTTMSKFLMCPQCASEYSEPGNRRFHAQPNACPQCGPSVKLIKNGPELGSGTIAYPIKTAIGLLKEGAIMGVKGIGGFHLCCDAENETAVKRLREKKRRSNKPFALMSPGIDAIKEFCIVSEEDERLLNDRRRPIVLLRRKVRGQRSEIAGKEIGLPDDVAPNNKYLGFMLPYTPLHYLLFHYPVAEGIQLACHFNALVMTSGNISEEPIVTGNDEAIDKLSGIADAFLLHDRDIFMRVDDSVIKAESGKPGIGEPEQRHRKFSFVRRARGFAPDPVLLTEEGPDVLGCGADLKNCFTLTKGRYAVISQHMGDMENLETLRFFEETLVNLKQVYRSEPVAIAYDLHPSYMSSQWALKEMERTGVQGFAVQHHYAHIASVMAENGLKEKIIGIALDGTGYGTDGRLWGGEFLICDVSSFSRAAHFNYMPLPGGEMAIKECWRTAVSAVAGSLHGRGKAPEHPGSDILKIFDAVEFIERYGRDAVETILKLSSYKQFSPLSSGAGRLFDAVSALTGVCDRNTYEGEAAIALENEIDNEAKEAYSFDVIGRGPIRIDFSKMFRGIIDDIKNSEPKGRIAAGFHNTMVEVIKTVSSLLRDEYGLEKVALSGGVFQNRYIYDRAYAALESLGFKVFTNINVPCNDACISLGQAYLLRERLKAGLPLHSISTD